LGLTYNLRVGTSPGGAEVMATMANASSGLRRVVQLGNTNHSTSWSIPLSSIPLTSRLYFSVQAIDHSFAGSAFSVEKAFGAMPEIQSILDVGNDQGRQVRVRWIRSFLDAPGASPVITSYALWRRVGAYKPGSPAQKNRGGRPEQAAMPPGTWDFVLTVPARGNDSYSVVAPTLCDSTQSGVCYSVFFISGLTADPHIYFDSEPDSGYSKDNLAPAAPQGLVAQVQGQSRVTLAWHEVEVADFAHYAVYRGTSSGFPRNESSRIGYSISPSFEDLIDQTGLYYYVITAVDFAGNEGLPSQEKPVNLTTTSTPSPVAYRWWLHQNRPNPFNPWTTISFELKEASPVQVVIYDARGATLVTLVDRIYPAGRHEVTWDGRDDRGIQLASGEYFYKLVAGSFVDKKKMTILR
jgi:flagellar hook capping protein FlgD